MAAQDIPLTVRGRRPSLQSAALANQLIARLNAATKLGFSPNGIATASFGQGEWTIRFRDIDRLHPIDA